MRLALKLMMAFMGLFVVVLAIEGGQRLAEERKLLERDMRHEQSTLGRALRPSVERRWKRAGVAAAEELLHRAQDGEAEVKIRLVALRAGASGAELEAPVPTVAREGTSFVRASPSPHLYTYLPVEGPDGHGSALELSQGLMGVESRLQRSRERIAITTLLLLLGSAALAVWLGQEMVGRKVRKLVLQTERVAEGHLQSFGPSLRRDELGALHNAIDAMVVSLSRTKSAAENEARARHEAEEKVHHHRRLAAVGTLAAGVAHELGTPLQVVGGRARMIESLTKSDEVRRHARIVREQSKNMETTVRELLSLARPPTRHRSDVNLGEIVSQVVEALEPQARQHDVSIDVVTGYEGTVQGSREHLTQLVTNLVDNAIQAVSDDGCVSISITKEDAAFPVEVARADGRDAGGTQHREYVCVEVADDGAGLTEDLKDKVFAPFFTTKPVGQGTGLGLSVAYSIAREHHGWLELAQGSHHATAFRLFLPLEASD